MTEQSNALEYEPSHHEEALGEPHTFFDTDEYPAVQFEDKLQQKETAILGMWIFLATEVLLFGGLFCGYFAYRHAYTAEFQAGSHHLFVWIGSTNTAILLGSSLCMALAINAASMARRKATVVYLLLTMALGLSFLALKGIEYWLDYREGVVPWFGVWDMHHKGLSAQVRLFMIFYFIMTALHALHMMAGLTVVSIVTWMAHRGKFNPDYYTPLDVVGLYWHFVDIVWLFLLPTFYLVTP